MKARTLPIWKHLSHLSVYECVLQVPSAIQGHWATLTDLDCSPRSMRMKMVSFRSRQGSKHIVSTCIATTTLTYANWVRIALINVSKLSDENVLPLDLNIVNFKDSWAPRDRDISNNVQRHVAPSIGGRCCHHSATRSQRTWLLLRSNIEPLNLNSYLANG